MPRMKNTARPQDEAPKIIDDDPVPADIDDFRRELASRIQKFMAGHENWWRQCTKPACRRARACKGKGPGCAARPPTPELPPEESARRRAILRRKVGAFVARKRLSAVDKSDQQS